MSEFLICLSITVLIDVLKMSLILWYKNTSSNRSNNFRTDQLSHPYSNKLQGMALSNIYFENTSTCSSVIPDST